MAGALLSPIARTLFAAVAWLLLVAASALAQPGDGSIFAPPPSMGPPGMGPPGAGAMPYESSGMPFMAAPMTGGEACPPGAAEMLAPMRGPTGPWETGPSPRPWLMRQFDLRHSSTHGRAMGPGTPLRGTSWRNRPHWLSIDGGALLMADRVAPNVRSNNDLFAAVGLGWDWDHYWGSQVRIGWSTPELVNTLQTAASKADNLFITDFSLLYYPWGDSRLRPYYRLGLGLTDVEYTNDFGRRQQDMLFTIPLGVGLKYHVGRNVAWRLEFVDNLAIGQNETSALNNLTLTGGVEWRFGGRKGSYWGWAPRGLGW